MTLKLPFRKFLSLVFAVAIVSVVWLVILPAHARQEDMQKHLQWLDSQGIDPSAMYYTELQVMEEILEHQRAEQLRMNANPD